VTSDVDPAAPDPPAGPDADPGETDRHTESASLFDAAAEPPPPARPTKRAAGGTQRAQGATGAPAKRASTPRAPAKKAPRASPSRRPATEDPVPVEAAPPANVAVDAPSVDHDDDEVDSPTRRRPTSWPDRGVIVVAVLLVVVVVLVLGVLGTGLGAPAKQASAGARLGAAFVGQVGTADGLALVIAAAVLAWAADAGAARQAVVVLRWAVLLPAVALLVAAPFAVWGDVAYLHRTHQVVDLVTRRQLATYLAVTMIPDGLAVVLAWWVRAPQVVALGSRRPPSRNLPSPPAS
jgi:hypothetical protein